MSKARTQVHLIVGGYPPGSLAGHDMDYARARLLNLLLETGTVHATVSNDFADLERWLPGSQLLISYVAGPFPDEQQNNLLRRWLDGGGRWLALHGTSGGKAAAVGDNRRMRKMVKMAHHQTLGAFFLNHPPIRKFRVNVTAAHPLTSGVPASFEVVDELYLIEFLHPSESTVLLTTELEKDPSPPGFGFVYDSDTSLMPDGKTRVLGYVRNLGKGAITYFALGHCHQASSNIQPFVDRTVTDDGATPKALRGSWESPAFERLLRNAIDWGAGAESLMLSPQA
ncbi:MAG TPA: ThuA domain-containing protein [Candidatus Binataceae bacterium]|nr:ThuA domain-containing protein [Candidatus Binataceae bacterium]